MNTHKHTNSLAALGEACVYLREISFPTHGRPFAHEQLPGQVCELRITQCGKHKGLQPSVDVGTRLCLKPFKAAFLLCDAAWASRAGHHAVSSKQLAPAHGAGHKGSHELFDFCVPSRWFGA